MERGYALVEQLDLAVEQLVVGSPVAARFALILCDNVVEIVMHQACVTAVAWDRYSSRISPPKYDDATRKEVTGQRFDAKARFCVKLGLISGDQLEVVLTVHRYRNELYHVGVRHDPIILPLAWLYFEIACELLPKLRVNMWHVVDPQSERVVRHIGNQGLFGGEPWTKAAASLMDSRPGLPKAFQAMLADFALDQLERCSRNLEFLVEDNPSGMGDGEMLEHIQFMHHCFDGDERRLDTTNIKTVHELDEAMQRLRATWRPPFSSSPLNRWSKRGRQLRAETNAYKALKKFETLQNESHDFRRLVDEAAAELDAHIQQEIDLARGK